MKEYKARIAFVNQKQLKGRQALHRIFLKPQYKVYRGLSVLYFNASFPGVPFFQNISTSRLEPINGKQCCLTFLSFKISLEANKDQISDHSKSRTRFLITPKIVLDFCFILEFTVKIFILLFLNQSTLQCSIDLENRP